MKREWRKISGVDNYFVSNDGRIKSFARYKKGLIKSLNIVNGYHAVRINGSGKLYCYVHRLVAQEFIPNPENKPCINHKDANRINNHVSNLEWCTRLENQRHAIENGLYRIRENHPRAKLNEKQVGEIRKKYSLGNTTYKKLADEYGLSKSGIGGIISFRRW